MSKIKKILAPTDYSDLSCVGLRRAFENAHDAGAELIVLHVVDWVPTGSANIEDLGPIRTLMAEQTEFLDKFLREKFGELMNLVEVRQKVELGAAHVNIADLAGREAVDLVIMFHPWAHRAGSYSARQRHGESDRPCALSGAGDSRAQAASTAVCGGMTG